MCGISGIFGVNSPDSITDMVRCVSHRGPDGSGHYIDHMDNGTISMGHSRLAIMDISGSSQPMISDHGRVLIQNGEIYNGADDDGSGTVAMLEIAEAFKKAVKKGKGPKRSIVFLHVTGEEKGLLGSRYYTDKDPIYPLENTVVNLNIDMIGRIDPTREAKNRDYI